MREENPNHFEPEHDDSRSDDDTPYESVRDLDARPSWSYLDVHDRPTFVP